ncbi:MAG TPA: TetR/AcrR family transcriptional regulator [Candidatus Saccharimonadales bacterium]|jgi:AcrR family transcriptional regulator|nr:TetR/AcrR family transcriptional regulator [Candidatus Saccharimonadales bacterium]
MKRNVKQRVLEASIRLFSEYGFYGVTIPELAEGANTNLHGVYRSSADKEGAFSDALQATVRGAPDPAQIALMVLENKDEQDHHALIKSAVQGWYASLTPQAARLMMQAYLSKKQKWEQPPVDYLDRVTNVLTRSMEAEARPAKDHPRDKNKFDARSAAKTLVMALFLFKIMETPSKSRQEEAEAVSGIVEHCLRGLA